MGNVDDNTKFMNSLKSSIITIGVMILLSSVLSYITIIIKSLHNPCFETTTEGCESYNSNQSNNVIEILNIVTSSSNLLSRIDIANNLFDPTKWIKPYEIFQSYSLLFSVEPIITTNDDSKKYFNHIYTALMAIPFLHGMNKYFNSPHMGSIQPLNDDLNNIYKTTDDSSKLLQWDTAISHYIIYYLFSVITKSVNTNLFVYKLFISYVSNWSENTLFLLYSFFGKFIMYGMAIISTIILFITSISEIPKLFSDRTPDKNDKNKIKWSINSLQFINPYRLFVVWLFGVGYTFLFLFLSLFIFIFTLFIPLSLKGMVSKYFTSIKNNIPFHFIESEQTIPIKDSTKTTNMTKVTIDVVHNINYFNYMNKFLYKNKNYIFYIAIGYLLLDISLSYKSPVQLVTFFIFLTIICLMGVFNYSIDISNIQHLQHTSLLTKMN